MRVRLFLGMTLMWLSMAGCGDDDRPPAGTGDSGIRRDGGPGVDGGSMDGGPGADGGPADAATDGGDTDGGLRLDGGMAPGCVTPAIDRYTLATEARNEPQRVATAGGVDRFTVTWYELRDGREDVIARVIPSSGDPMADVRITDDLAINRDPVVVDVGDAVLLSWFDNSASNYEIFAQARTPALAASGEVHRLTNNALRDDTPELVRVGPQVIALWVERDFDASTAVARARLLGLDATPASDAVAASPEAAAPTLIRGAPFRSNAILAWTELSGGSADVVIQRLDSGGGMDGTPVGVTDEHNASGEVDVATVELGGAAVFGVSVGGTRPEVRFRGFDTVGTATTPERILTPAPERASGPSVAPLAGGWVVAYRALEDDDLTEPVIRLAFVDGVGNIAGKTDVSATTTTDTPTEVAVASDGSILVTWADVDGGTTTLEAARIRCD